MKKFIKWFLIIVVGFYSFIIVGEFLYQEFGPPEPEFLNQKECNDASREWTNFGFDKNDVSYSCHECEYGFNPYKNICCNDDADYTCEICQPNQSGCSQYDNQEDAQIFYDECKNFTNNDMDILNLDTDGDGIACESLILSEEEKDERIEQLESMMEDLTGEPVQY